MRNALATRTRHTKRPAGDRDRGQSRHVYSTKTQASMFYRKNVMPICGRSIGRRGKKTQWEGEGRA